MNAISTRPVGSIADLDPVNNFYGSLSHHQSNSQFEGRMMPPHKQTIPKSGVSLSD